jgi:hypothetical protein
MEDRLTDKLAATLEGSSVLVANQDGGGAGDLSPSATVKPSLAAFKVEGLAMTFVPLLFVMNIW